LKNKILLLGYGFLGKAISNEALKRNYHIKKTRLHNDNETIQLDITNQNQVYELITYHKPNVIINCISRNDIDNLEKNPKLATNVNVKGIKNLAEICKKTGIRLIHISTDSIFDGIKNMYLENDKPNPINNYAKSKLKGENEIIKKCNNFVIIRTNLFGINEFGKYLLNNIITKLKNKEKIIGFNDVIFNPLSVENLAQQIVDVSLSDYKGILNLASDKPISKLEFCQIIAKKLDFENFSITSESVDKYNFLAKRPKNTSLDNTLSKSIVKHKSLNFEEWIELNKIRIKQFFDLE